MEVVGILGVAGSPSCGAATTLDLEAALRILGACPHRALTTEWLNEAVVDPATRPGTGLFLGALSRELSSRRHRVPTTEVVLRPRASSDS